MFININVRSHYSLLMSSITVDDIISFAIQNGQKKVFLIDVVNMHATPEFFIKAKKNNLIPVVGITIEHEGQELILIAKNHRGYVNLSTISSHILMKQDLDLKKYLSDLNVICSQTKINDTAFLKSDLAIHDVYCQTESDITTVLALRAIGSDQKLEEITSESISSPCWFLTEETARNHFSPEQIKNLDSIVNTCDAYDIFQRGKVNFVKYDRRYSSEILLQTLCRDGLKARMGSISAPTPYIERLQYELDIIQKMNFCDYFLVVHDYVSFAKDHRIMVGPGRGSAAGSLVAYVLGITEVDPIKHDLIFERFLNPERTSMPDIDIDFMDDRRNEVVDYVFEKYGSNRAAHIVTFQRMKSKMALRDVGRILGIDIGIIGAITKSFSFEYDGDIQLAIDENKAIASYAKKYPELFSMAKKILNFPRQIGVHAAGVVITETNIWENVPVMEANDGSIVTQYSMEYLEDLGLIKMDILGLVNLTIIGKAIELIRKNHGRAVNLSKIPLDDRRVFADLSAGETTGIFQLESPGMRNVIRKIRPNTVEDISITSALFRPGPQKNIPVYLENKAHPENIKYLNEDFEKVLKSTYNVMVYQEQVIQIVREITDFSAGKADMFRRAISKKDPAVFAKIEVEFCQAGIRNGYAEEEVRETFNYICEFANYGFNHSHSLAYSYISYWMAFIRTYFPLEFFTTLMSSSDNSVDKIVTYMASAKGLGIEVLPPSINKSDYSFSIYMKSIIFGLNSIAGIGNETIIKIFDARTNHPKKEFENYIDAVGRLAHAGVGMRAIEALIYAGCFDCFEGKNERNYMIQNLPEVFEKSKTMLKTGEMLIKPVLKDVKTTKAIIQELDGEQFRLLGVNFGTHPAQELRKKYDGEYKLTKLIGITQSQYDVTHALVFLKSITKRVDKNGNSYAMASIEDDTKIANAVIFSSIYNNVKDILENDRPFVAGLRLTDRGFQIMSLREVEYDGE